MHVHIDEINGNVVDVIYFCSDACHQQYILNHPDLTYDGWNGCNEGGDSIEFCSNCGVVAGGTYECDCQRDNVVVNRFPSKEGEKCEHDNYIQLPANHPHLV